MKHSHGVRSVVCLIFLTAIHPALFSLSHADIMNYTLEAGSYQIVERPDSSVRIVMDDFTHISIPGHPRLPARTFLVVLPPDAEVRSVKVRGENETELLAHYRIEPAPTIGILSSKPEQDTQDQAEWARNNQDVYGQDDWYPATAGYYDGIGTLREYRYVRVVYYPFSVRPQSGRLVFRPTLNVEIEFDHAAPEPARYETDRIRAKKVEQAARIFVNYPYMHRLYAALPGVRASAETYDYVLITSPELIDAFSLLVDWKQAIGFSVKVITPGWIDSTYGGRDIQEKTRNFLIDKYAEWGIDYLLIGGGLDVLPMRYCYPDPENHGYDDQFCPPTDQYYADLTGDWDSDGDGYFGEFGQDDVDFASEIYVGRIPFSSPDSVAAICRKSVVFESDRGAWKNSALLAGTFANFENQDYSGYAETDLATMTEVTAANLMPGWPCTRLYETQGLVVSKYACDIPVSLDNFTAAWGAGQYGLVNWGGHGSPIAVARSVWMSDDGDGVAEWAAGELRLPGLMHMVYTNRLDDLHPSITFQVSCNNATPEGPNLAAQLLYEGAVATLASTRIAFYAKGWENELDGLVASNSYFFMEQIVQDGARVGDALFDSKTNYAAVFPFFLYKHYQNLFDYNLYGDPSLVRQGVAFTCLDTDGDGVGDPGQIAVVCGEDNCPSAGNADQADYDDDGYGDVCDHCPRYVIPGNGSLASGDTNYDSSVTSADVIYLVQYVFRSGPSPLPLEVCGDIDCNGTISSADIVRLVGYVFKSGAEPCDICVTE